MKGPELFGTIVMFVAIGLFSIGILMQECQADEDDEEPFEKKLEDITKAIRDFHSAWRDRNMKLMDEIWSHEDDARIVFYTIAVTENNFDYRSWTLVRPFISTIFPFGDPAPRLRGSSTTLDGEEASTTFDSNILEPHSDQGFALLRKEDGNWKIYLYDFTCLLASQTGDDSGFFVEIAFEAENGKGAAGFIFDDPDASEGRYILNMGRTSFVFNIPEEGEYTVWGRTHAPNSDANSFSVTIDNLSSRWDVGCSPAWTWNQMNFAGNMGPKILKLEDGTHTFSLRRFEDGTKLDAIYITDNLSLRADQIQQRFELTMGYTEKSKTVGMMGILTTTWAAIKFY